MYLTLLTKFSDFNFRMVVKVPLRIFNIDSTGSSEFEYDSKSCYGLQYLPGVGVMTRLFIVAVREFVTKEFFAFLISNRLS